MKENSLGFNKIIDEDHGFKASYWCIFNVSNISGIVGINAHGEAKENSDKEYQKIINDRKPGL